MDYILLASVGVSFLLTALVLPYWIKKAKLVGLLWEDMNKYNKPKVAGSGGVVVVMAFVISILFYIFLKTFILGQTPHEIELFALLSMILIFGMIGLTDDLLGWRNGGLSARARVVLAIMAAIPLVVINAGSSSVSLPLFGTINFGIFYPLVIIPLAVGFVATTYNFLAGFNGLESGLGILILSYLSFVAFVTGSPWLAVVGLSMVASLIVFIYYNWFPARVFPGDILTYAIGAVVVGMAILGNFEKIAIIVFIPFLIEAVLKAGRGKLVKHSFGKPSKNNALSLKYDKVYGLTHFSIWYLKKFKKKVTEKDVVYFIYSIEILCILLATLFLL